MISKGNQRAGGRQLASHLLNAHDNERVEVAEVRGSVANDLHGAFAEWNAQARATQCTKYLYSLSVNPDQRQGHLSRDQYLDFIERAEQRLGLAGQGRAVVFHWKKDRGGTAREHCHVVWSRIDSNATKAVNIAHDRMKLRSVAREFAMAHGLELPLGMKEDRGAGRYAARVGHADLHEKQQEERSGFSKEERLAVLTEVWRKTGDGVAFGKAIERAGFILARGDGRAYVVIDRAGDVHSLSRQLAGVTSAFLKERLEPSHPLSSLPSVGQAQAIVAERLEKLQQIENGRRSLTEVFTLEERRAAFVTRQHDRRRPLERDHQAMETRHGRERETLAMLHEEQRTGVKEQRQPKRPHGLVEFLRRVTGIRAIATQLDQRRDRKLATLHQQQRQALESRQEAEKKDMTRQDRALSAIETREQRSFEVRLKRENFQHINQKAQALDHVMERMEKRHVEHENSPAPRMAHRAAHIGGFPPSTTAETFRNATGKTNMPEPDLSESDVARRQEMERESGRLRELERQRQAQLRLER